MQLKYIKPLPQQVHPPYKILPSVPSVKTFPWQPEQQGCFHLPIYQLLFEEILQHPKAKKWKVSIYQRLNIKDKDLIYSIQLRFVSFCSVWGVRPRGSDGAIQANRNQDKNSPATCIEYMYTIFFTVFTINSLQTIKIRNHTVVYQN